MFTVQRTGNDLICTRKTDYSSAQKRNRKWIRDELRNTFTFRSKTTETPQELCDVTPGHLMTSQITCSHQQLPARPTLYRQEMICFHVQYISSQRKLRVSFTSGTKSLNVRLWYDQSYSFHGDRFSKLSSVAPPWR